MKTTKPAKRKRMGRAMRDTKHAAYEENRETIVADLITKGQTATLLEWKIPKGTISKLVNRWLTPEQREQMHKAGMPGHAGRTTRPAAGNGRLPAFPEFSSTWQPEVQLKWLEIYETLTMKDKGVQ